MPSPLPSDALLAQELLLSAAADPAIAEFTMADYALIDRAVDGRGAQWIGAAAAFLQSRLARSVERSAATSREWLPEFLARVSAPRAP